MSDAAGQWLLDEAGAAMVAGGVRRLPRRARLGALGFTKGRTRSGRCAGGGRRIRPAARRGRRRGRRRRRGRGHRPRGDRAGRGVHFARHRDAADRRDGSLSRAPDRLVHSFAHALPGRWYAMAAMLNGAGALAFAARLLGSSPDALEREAADGYRGPGRARVPDERAKPTISPGPSSSTTAASSTPRPTAASPRSSTSRSPTAACPATAA